MEEQEKKDQSSKTREERHAVEMIIGISKIVEK